ncbi:hypothetical protein [Xanthomonas medicagonis]
MRLLATLLSSSYYAQDHATWFGDLRALAEQHSAGRIVINA